MGNGSFRLDKPVRNGVAVARLYNATRERVIVGTSTSPQTLPIRIASALCIPVLPRAIPRKDMVDLDLDQILETADTIVHELLATGEFG